MPPATLERLPCRDMLTARPAAPRTVTMDAVLTPSCATIIKIRNTYSSVLAADIRNLDTPTSIDVLAMNLSRILRRKLISFFPTMNITSEIMILKTSVCSEGAILSISFCIAVGDRSDVSMVDRSTSSTHAVRLTTLLINCKFLSQPCRFCRFRGLFSAVPVSFAVEGKAELFLLALRLSGLPLGLGLSFFK